ncbi:uncharacterized protein [Atheta coriaria]|uniref:uncharacterized protein n=1 Tax=Dalotia coriaria TaxID=877792 RepID=UPI0031F42DF4
MKRFANNYAGGSSEKRAKLINEDPWGDSDPDIEHFLLQASQIVDEIPVNDNKPVENESIVTYNGFAHPSMVASTQFDASIWAHPANSSKCLPVRTNKQDELQKLKEEVLNKEGEITILRTQLKQSKEHAELNYSKKLNESVDKIQLIQSEKERISTELDFKNMEIVNLKKKLENITKNLFDNSTLSKTSRIIDNSIIPLGGYKVFYKFLLFFNFPLKSVIPLKIFESVDDDKFPKILSPNKTTDERYLHSLMFPSCHGQQEKGSFTYIRFGEPLRIKHFFDTIRSLRDASEWELENATNSVNQIYLLTLTFLTNHLEYLTRFVKLVQKDEVREYDVRKAQNSTQSGLINVALLEPINCDSAVEECAMQCRQCLALLAAIYPHNKYLRNVFNHNKPLQSSECERETWPFAFSTLLTARGEQNMLIILHRIVKIIGDTRRGNLYSGLLSSICLLLAEIVRYSEEKFEQIGVLIVEIVLTTPSFTVLYYMSELFKHGSSNLHIEQMCRNPRVNVLERKKVDGVSPNVNFCITDIFFSHCRHALVKILSTNSKDFRMHLNLVHFITNSINSNVGWMYFQPVVIVKKNIVKLELK